MKSLERIMKIIRAGKVISRLALVLSIVALLVLLVFFMFFILETESSTGEKYFFEQVQEGSRKIEDLDILLYCIALILVLVSNIYIMNCAYKYFSRTLEKGTPFNRGSVNELKKLGIVTSCIPFIIQIVTDLFVILATDEVFTGSRIMDYNPVPSVSVGIMLLFLSAVSRYGILSEQKTRA